MYQAIVTKYAGPTNTRGARIIVTAEAGRKFVSWDHALNADENHIAAAKSFAEFYGWTGEWVGGALPDSKGYAFVSSRGRTLADFVVGA